MTSSCWYIKRKLPKIINSIIYSKDSRNRKSESINQYYNGRVYSLLRLSTSACGSQLKKVFAFYVSNFCVYVLYERLRFPFWILRLLIYMEWAADWLTSMFVCVQNLGPDKVKSLLFVIFNVKLKSGRFGLHGAVKRKPLSRVDFFRV